MPRYEIIVEDIASSDETAGYSTVLAVQAVIDKKVLRDEEQYAEVFIHELIESINQASLCYTIKHDDLSIVAKELSHILLATGWKPPVIPPEGFKID